MISSRRDFQVWKFQWKIIQWLVFLSTSFEKQLCPCLIVFGFILGILTQTTFIFFSLINLFEKQQLRKHCVTALKVFTCCLNSLCTDYTHSTGARRFLLRSPKAFREKPLELYFFFTWNQVRSLRISTILKDFTSFFFFYIHFSVFISYLITLFIIFFINKKNFIPGNSGKDSWLLPPH